MCVVVSPVRESVVYLRIIKIKSDFIEICLLVLELKTVFA